MESKFGVKQAVLGLNPASVSDQLDLKMLACQMGRVLAPSSGLNELVSVLKAFARVPEAQQMLKKWQLLPVVGTCKEAFPILSWLIV